MFWKLFISQTRQGPAHVTRAQLLDTFFTLTCSIETSSLPFWYSLLNGAIGRELYQWIEFSDFLHAHSRQMTSSSSIPILPVLSYCLAKTRLLHQHSQLWKLTDRAEDNYFTAVWYIIFKGRAAKGLERELCFPCAPSAQLPNGNLAFGFLY